jgi:hypothetical protein
MKAQVTVSVNEEGLFRIESDAPAGVILMLLSDAIGQVSRKIYGADEEQPSAEEVQ